MAEQEHNTDLENNHSETESGSEKSDARSELLKKHKAEIQAFRTKWNSSSKPKKPAARKKFNQELKQQEEILLKKHSEELKEIEKKEEPVATVVSQAPTSQPISGQKKVSKAQRRRKAKAAREKQIRDQLEEERTQTSTSNVRENEQKSLSEKLSKLNLTIKRITPDGNCLFNAIVDQLNLSNVSSTPQILRSQAADFILENPSEFVPFIDTDVESFDSYCSNLRNTMVWGGQIELLALAHVLRRAIHVYSADAPVVEMGAGYLSSGSPAIILSYHKHEYTMGEHYNSCVPFVEKDDEAGFV